MLVVVTVGAALGVVSRVEEVSDAFDLGISSNLTWLATAFVLGAVAGRARLDWSGLAGAAALTAANAGYYAYVLATEPGRPLETVAGPVDRWFALGVTGGFVFGAAGALLRGGTRARRALAFAPLAALLVAQRVPALERLLP